MTVLTQSECPENVRVQYLPRQHAWQMAVELFDDAYPLATSHTRIVSSRLADTKWSPSGVKRTVDTE